MILSNLLILLIEYWKSNVLLVQNDRSRLKGALTTQQHQEFAGNTRVGNKSY